MTEVRRVYADTNALVPYYLSDLLLLLSFDRVIRLFWSDYLIREVCDVATRGRWRKHGLDRRNVEQQWDAVKTSRLSQDEISEALWKTKMHVVSGPDLDDYPHTAAALAAKVGVLITSDRKGFDTDMLAVHGIEVQSPDTFLHQLLLEMPEEVLAVIKRRQAKLWNPPLGLNSYVSQLSKSVPMFASVLGAHLEFC
ncbi:MAG: PIN domain-containing protein [Candidatus Nanopelagicaceae bacterium]|nr:PIN domain-containing protein [Candidatus Nanopelagicaceae bacterium]